jgi:predicted amidohydrolase
MQAVEIAYAHLGRSAYYTYDNPYLRSVMSQRLSPRRRAILERVSDGTINLDTWLDTSFAEELLEAITVGVVPRDLQLVLRDGAERVGVESVHAFLRAPLFWWLVSHLWCLEVGRAVDGRLDERVMGYRLHPSFRAAPQASPQMFGSPSAAHRRWRHSATEMSAEHVGQFLATSTIDLQAFYYSITAAPSAIVAAFLAGTPGARALSRRGVVLTRLLDALHLRYAAEIRRVGPRPEATPSDTLPLPVGLPSSRILGNLVMAVALRDIVALPDVVGAAAYADDVLVLSPALRDVDESVLQYFLRLGVVETETDGDEAWLASSAGRELATLIVNTNKSEISYSRVRATESEGAPQAATQPFGTDDVDPYITGLPSADWGGRLRTVLRSPYRRDRVPRELAQEIRRITDEIRVGIERADALAGVEALLRDLDQGSFLALRSQWPALLASSWYAGGGTAIDGLNAMLDLVVKTIEPPPNASDELRDAINRGLRDAWAQALAEALSLRGSARWTSRSRPDPELLRQATGLELMVLTGRARRLRAGRFVTAEFVSVPLAEFSAWSGGLFGPAAFRAFMRRATGGDDLTSLDLTSAKRFIDLHEICMANHLWAAPGARSWRNRVFSTMRRQPLIDPGLARDLQLRAGAILRSGDPPDDRASRIEDYTLRIAIPSLEVAGQHQLDAVIDEDRAALSDVARSARKQVTKVVNSAARRRADVVVLPEWAVVRGQLSWLFARSAEHQMLVVAGEAPSVTNGVYSNRVWTGLPLVDAAGHRACLVPPPREKRYLSPHEESALKDGGLARTTEKRPIQVYNWRGINLASLICFEFADVRARERLRADADFVTVSSWNTDWRYFAAVQEATTRDNYCVSLCVNTSQFPGTTLMRPTRSAMAIAASVHGSSDPTVVTREVDMLPIVASRAVGRRPSEISGLPEPTDGLQLKDFAAVPPTFR